MLRLQRLARQPGAETLPVAGAATCWPRALTGGDQPIGAVRALRWRTCPPGCTCRRRAPPGPLLVFFHGGGFMYGDLDSHDADLPVPGRAAGVRVLAVDYRLAPEHPFPAAYDDAVAAYPGRSSTPPSSAPTRPGSRSAATRPAATWRRAWRSRRPGTAGRARCSCWSTRPPTRPAQTRSAELFGDGFYLTREYMDRAATYYVPDDLTATTRGSRRSPPSCPPAWHRR